MYTDSEFFECLDGDSDVGDSDVGDEQHVSEEQIIFSNLKVSTTTNIIYFKNVMSNPWIPFWFLPVRLKGEHLFDRSGRRKKLPEEMIEGRIYSLGYKGLTRGYVKSKKQFKHSLNAAISTKVNIPTVKISSDNIHICGLKDVKSIKTTALRVISHINAVYRNLKYLQNNRHRTVKAMNWFNHNCRGNTVKYEELDGYGNIVNVIDHKIVPPLGFPKDLDFVACNYIIRLMNECIYMGVGYMSKAIYLVKKFILSEPLHPLIPENYMYPEQFEEECCKGIKPITMDTEVSLIPEDVQLDLSYIRCVMTNYNFDVLKLLDCKDRIFMMYNLYESLDACDDHPFVVIYDPMINPSMKLYTAVKDDQGKYIHTITMKHTGSVIYTSGHNDTSCEVFETFIKLIRKFLHLTVDLTALSSKSRKYYQL